ncbi:MAG TPA: gluconokinase [Saprospiraceae bacterium]|nr:gluconokinase [Saprospiraceae bacterium]
MLIAVDIGTTNIKAVALNDAGALLAQAERHNTTRSDQPGWQEQDPAHIFQNVTAVLAETWQVVQGREILHGVVFSSAMHGLLALDDAGKPLTNILLWSDLRSSVIAGALRQQEAGLNLYSRTGVPIHAMSPLCKAIWLRQNRPEIFKKTHLFADIKSWIWNRLTGEFACDLAVASASGLMDIRQKKWDAEALGLAGIEEARLPLLVAPSHTASVLNEVAGRYNLPSDVPYIIGASDGALANIGSNATQPGQIAITIGTSAAIRMITSQAVLDESMRTFCYCVDAQRYIVGGASNNGTNVLEWLRKSVFRSSLTAAAFAEMASEVPEGSGGLLFLPYLWGERAPLYDAQVRGSFQNLAAQHAQPHFVRAAMEGVLFNVKIIAEALEAHGPVHTLHAGGGFSRNPLWVQMLADIFQKTVVLPDENVDASLLGAIRCAQEALKLSRQNESTLSRRIDPNTVLASVYSNAYLEFRDRVGELKNRSLPEF